MGLAKKYLIDSNLLSNQYRKKFVINFYFALKTFHTEIFMKQQQTSPSIQPSIHQIILQENKNKLRKDQVQLLFAAPQLIEIDTSDFNRHPYMLKNQLFTFFVHQLQKWNKKIKNRQVTPFYHAELKKYHFIQSTLKIIALKKQQQITQYLRQLSRWYSKNSYNIPQPGVLMKKYDASEQWQIRKTFKSNTPSEINNYRRRFFYSQENKDAMLKKFATQVNGSVRKNGSKNKFKITMTNTLYDEFEDDRFKSALTQAGPFRQINNISEKNFIKNQNAEVMRSREDDEVKEIEDQWRRTHSRFGGRTCQNFYNGNFHANKHFMQSARIPARNIFTASYNTRNSQEAQIVNNIKKRRLRTSLGFRNNVAKQQQNPSRIEERKSIQNKSQKKVEKKQSIEKGKHQHKEKEKQVDPVAHWIDNFLVDQENLTIANTFDCHGNAMRLISNPFDMPKKSKIKRKKK